MCLGRGGALWLGRTLKERKKGSFPVPSVSRHRDAVRSAKRPRVERSLSPSCRQGHRGMGRQLPRVQCGQSRCEGIPRRLILSLSPRTSTRRPVQSIARKSCSLALPALPPPVGRDAKGNQIVTSDRNIITEVSLLSFPKKDNSVKKKGHSN